MRIYICLRAIVVVVYVPISLDRCTKVERPFEIQLVHAFYGMYITRAKLENEELIIKDIF